MSAQRRPYREAKHIEEQIRLAAGDYVNNQLANMGSLHISQEAWEQCVAKIVKVLKEVWR